MKILEIIPHLNAGGAETFVVNLSNELAAREDCNVTLLTFFPKKENEFLWGKLNAQVQTVCLNKALGFDTSLLYRLYRLIKNGGYDIVHSHIQAIPYTLLSCVLNKRCKYFATIHNDAFKEAKGYQRYVRKLLFRLKLTTPITISDESESSFQQLYSTPSRLIYNGVPRFTHNNSFNCDGFRRTPKTKLFLCAASITRVKNEVAVAKAFNRIYNEGYDAAVIFIGKPREADYANMLKQEESDAVHYLGEVSNPVDYMSSCDFFILASHYEGLPISLLEAVSVGCIPVVTPVGGNINVVKDDYNGYIIQTLSEDDIYAALKRCLTTTGQDIGRIKQNLLKSSRKYSIEYCADEHLRMFRSQLK